MTAILCRLGLGSETGFAEAYLKSIQGRSPADSHNEQGKAGKAEVLI